MELQLDIYNKVKEEHVSNSEVAKKLGLTLSAISKRNERGFGGQDNSTIGELVKLTELYNKDKQPENKLSTYYNKNMLKFYHKVFKDDKPKFLSKGVIDFISGHKSFFYNKHQMKEVFSEEELDIDKVKYSWYLLLEDLYPYYNTKSPGKNFRKLLENKGINPHQFSKKVELAPSYITRLIIEDEKGIRSLRQLTKKTITRLAHALDMTELDFITVLFKENIDEI